MATQHGHPNRELACLQAISEILTVIESVPHNNGNNKYIFLM